MFDADLNEEQRAVAAFDGGALRVLAGAGTGKTTALTARVAAIVERGTRPDRVLLLTFTRRAARQMMQRARQRVARSGNGDGNGRVVGGTFHSVACHALRRHGPRLGLPEGFSVLDRSDAADLVDLVREEHGWARRADRRLPRKHLLVDAYSRAVNTQAPLSTVLEATAPWAVDVADGVIEICRGYVERKRALGLVDFDDLLLWWRAALLDEQLGPRLASSFDHVLVDEYQDVNTLQVDVLRALRVGDQRITVVGDDAQAIYAFRAADPRHILDFEQVFPHCATIVLHRNYRSTQPICDVANAVADDAPEGFSARLRAERGPGAAPELVRCADEDDQVDAVCERVLAAREAGLRLAEQAVLIRAAHHSARLELELAARHIPYVKYGGLRFLEAAHVKDLVCAFRLVDNPRDELAWFRLLQLCDGVGPATARRAIDALGLGDDDALVRWPAAAALLPTAARDRAGALVASLAVRTGESIAAHATRIRDALVPLVDEHYDDGPARRTDLDALVAASAGAARLSDVAAELTLEPPHSTGDLAGPPAIDEDWLVISTVHSAKGLEWDAVHVLCATDGCFPSDMALSSATELEEERRLFYVAMTRARRQLHVYVPLRFHDRPFGRDDRHTYAQPSRFLSRRVVEQFTVHEPSPAPTLDAPRVTAALSHVDRALDALWS
jgi:DNA helicase-2/ATP-dependent DNA helicase PcrA